MKITKIIVVIAAFLLPATAFADGVTFTASAPEAIPNGQTFQLVYTVNARGKDLRVPEFSGFDVVAGPFQSTSHSVQFINGTATSQTTLRYTYTLLPTKEGTFTIASATIVVDNEKYQSNALTIKVLPADKVPDDAQQPNNRGQQPQSVPISQQITNENLFIRPIVSRTSVREQEPILLTYKVYSKVDLVNITEPKFPELQGFLVQEIDLPQNKQFALENYNGINYNTITLRQYLLYPQRTGTLDIDKMTCTAVVRVRNQRQVRSIFDDFFDSYQEVNRALTASAVKVKVEPLPTPKPADFCGGVGSFSVQSAINATEMNANDAVTVTVKIAGNGNMKLLQTPSLKFPADFEAYEPKVTNDFTNTTAGVTGTKTIEYLAIPRHSGDFEIPETTFSYFDVASQTYKTLAIPAYTLKVNKGNATDNAPAAVSNYTAQEQVRMLASDIRYIDTTDFAIAEQDEILAGSALFWVCYLLPLALAVVALWFFRKQAQQNADVAFVRNKKANKVARKRLKVAEKYLKTNAKSAFYDEVLKALWGYLCDKLSMPPADLNKENVATKLTAHHVSDEDIAAFIRLLDDCEYARYAPASDEHAAMDHIFSQTLAMIAKLEETIKR
ncbi:MAG: BatD family protein [Paludibacteraceae bacterium]